VNQRATPSRNTDDFASHGLVLPALASAPTIDFRRRRSRVGGRTGPLEDQAHLAQRLLSQARSGSESASGELLQLLYGELRDVARRCMEREHAGHTLQPTALVHEAWLRLFSGNETPSWESRAHFVHTVARAMRRVLIDHARARRSEKRGAGVRPEPLDRTIAYFEEHSIELLDLDRALAKLEEFDPELAHLVELRFFGGLSIPEIAPLLGVSVPTIERRWRVARGWLRGELHAEDDSGLG
jgi:RNA polymerase sigma factor (TIGR02999 family)